MFGRKAKQGADWLADVAFFEGFSAEELALRLRSLDPPIVGRRDEKEVVLDLRTVEPALDPLLVSALRGTVGDGGVRAKAPPE